MTDFEGILDKLDELEKNIADAYSFCVEETDEGLHTALENIYEIAQNLAENFCIKE